MSKINVTNGNYHYMSVYTGSTTMGYANDDNKWVDLVEWLEFYCKGRYTLEEDKECVEFASETDRLLFDLKFITTTDKGKNR